MGQFCVAQDDSAQRELAVPSSCTSRYYAEAIAGYRVFFENASGGGCVRSNLGAALAHEGRYTEAISGIHTSAFYPANDYGIRFNLALAYYKMGEIKQAVKEFEEVYAIQPATDPERRRLMLLLAECYLRQGEDERCDRASRPSGGYRS